MQDTQEASLSHCLHSFATSNTDTKTLQVIKLTYLYHRTKLLALVFTGQICFQEF